MTGQFPAAAIHFCGARLILRGVDSLFEFHCAEIASSCLFRFPITVSELRAGIWLSRGDVRTSSRNQLRALRDGLFDPTRSDQPNRMWASYRRNRDIRLGYTGDP